jgi:hypothetical protein
MAPIATADSVTTVERIGQLKLNAFAAPAPAPVQAQKKENVRVVDPFNYVVGHA